MLKVKRAYDAPGKRPTASEYSSIGYGHAVSAVRMLVSMNG